ncbi:hypothetical protein Tco_1124951 [Tanacetum coccineum]|uniref:CCHC-type domain-containing protein n=1 Tax=Tanacetum coccineum TaxID=301880 RepID=A0ABQ5J882_9ASTR
MFVKSSADNSEVSITSCNKPKLSEAEDSTLSNHDTGKVPSNESQRNKTDHPVVVSDYLVTDYDSADESLVCNTPFPPLEKLTGAEPVSGPKTIKSILKSKSTFKAETLKGIIINEPSSAPARGNKSSSASKTNLALAGKLKNVKMDDDPPLSTVMKELNELKLKIRKNKSSYFRNKNSQQAPPNALQNKYKTQFKMNCELCGQNNHLSENYYKVLFCKKCKRTNHKTCDHVEFMSSMNINQYHTVKCVSLPSRSGLFRGQENPFPSCIHCGYNYHKSDDCVYYPICEICGSYDHDTQWKIEALQAKKTESFKASKTESLSDLRSKTPTKRFQANPKESHLITVKRTFYTLSLGLQYPKHLGFDLKGYSDSDCAGCNMDRKSTSDACQLLEGKLVY